ncbi:hypothetical protein Sphch_3052 [Sphingobium chlorophenolicum L-1]|uniref:Uncharacterized protein n=1 Tax=Sphingobium chlorophenolicum L-1 TaxID=690566 RepID=F6F2L2_SPHCR|nr:hypothetical protein Sphch_3052 [Sphingobium chlorophenolicum L-1]
MDMRRLSSAFSIGASATIHQHLLRNRRFRELAAPNRFVDYLPISNRATVRRVRRNGCPWLPTYFTYTRRTLPLLSLALACMRRAHRDNRIWKFKNDINNAPDQRRAHFIKAGPQGAANNRTPRPSFYRMGDPPTFREALVLHLRRFSESYYQLHRSLSLASEWSSGGRIAAYLVDQSVNALPTIIMRTMTPVLRRRPWTR